MTSTLQIGLLSLLLTLGVGLTGCDSGGGGSGGSPGSGGSGGAVGSGGKGGSGGAGTVSVWTECPPQGAAPEGGPVTEATYQGKACSGSLQCFWVYADCPNLSGLGPSCDCVNGKFECEYHTCEGQSTGTGSATGGAGGGM